jgi:hypothetical protein
MALPNRCRRLLIDNRPWDTLSAKYLNAEGDSS